MVTRSVTNRYENLGGGGSGFTRYVAEKYEIFTIISHKLQCISNTFIQNSVKIFKCNHSCKFMHIYCYYIDIYSCFFDFESPWRTTFRFKVPHFLPKSLRNGRVGGGKMNLSLRSMKWGEGGRKSLL